MKHLSLVKSLAHLGEEKKHVDEVLIEPVGISFPRGAISEISGGPSSGKTSLSLYLLAKLTAAGEICAVVDPCGSFDARSAVLSGVELDNLLWARCGGSIEKAFMAVDHLLQAKGFGAVWLDLSGLAVNKLKLVPRTYWYRYRNRISQTPTLLLVTAREAVTGSAAQQAFVSSRTQARWSGSGKFKLLRELAVGFHSRKQLMAGPLPARIEADYSDV
ncbi:MAG TPA: hypothetical protein PKD26_16760 [Pyrinomonadaceae bacterium]|nr:hypothetical protein [Pyrinomonadaceae bacterium]